jgi:hypothetical protein
MDRGFGRVIDIRLSALWRDKLGATGLGDALIFAISAARVRYLESWFEGARGEDGAQSTSPAETFPPEALRGLTPHEQREAWHRIADLLNAVTAEAAATRERIQRANVDKPTYAGSDDSRKVSVVLNAAAVLSGLTIDDKWLASASTERVVNGLRDAFDSAYRAFDQAAGSDPATATPVADRAPVLASDTKHLVRWLRQED